MLQTLFTIPRQIAGIDVFGVGWLLGLWAIASLVVLGASLRQHGAGRATLSYVPLLSVIGLFIAFVLPALVQSAGVPIRGYGVMFLLSVVSAIGLAVYRAKRIGVDPEIILSLATWFVVSGIVGARLFYIIEYWDRFQKGTIGETIAAMVNITQGGLVVYGSLLAGGAAMVIFIHKYKLPGLALADLIAPAVVLGVALGRIGCFLNGCCYGGLCELPWAVRFPPESPAYFDQAQRGDLFLHGLIFKGSGAEPAIIAKVEPGSPAMRHGLKPGDRVTEINTHTIANVDEAQFELMRTYGAGAPLLIAVAGRSQPAQWTVEGPAPRSKPVHPTQIYSLIDALLLCAFLLAYEPYRRRVGELTALVLTIHPISRFLLEIIRVDESAVFNTGMSISQNISIAIFLGGVLLWIYLYARPPKVAVWPKHLAAAA